MKIGDVVQKVAIARWSRTLSALTSAGVPIMQAIEITGKTAGNAVIEKSMGDVITSVKGGGTISDAAAPVLGVPGDGRRRWSASARRPARSTRCSRRSRTSTTDEVEAAVKALTSIMEPVMIIFVGGIVGVIVISHVPAAVQRSTTASSRPRIRPAAPCASDAVPRPRVVCARAADRTSRPPL